MIYDAIIVGGSFAGLASAYFLAKKGLKVCLFDSRKIGSFTKSTGILTESVLSDLKVPSHLIETEIYGAYLYSPNMKEYGYKFSKPIFYQSNTLKFLEWFKGKVLENGAEIFEKKPCNKFKFSDSKVVCENVSGKLVIFASGLLPPFLRSQQLNLYTGLEYVARCDTIKDCEMFQVYLDYNICPGYFAWIAPNDNEIAHIGILRKSNGISASNAMKMFLKKADIKIKSVIETRGGLVPLTGPVEKTYGNRYIIIGDAAGHIGAFSSAGINYAIRISKMLPKIIPKCLDNPSEETFRIYEKTWKSEIGEILQSELRMRRFYDLMGSNQNIEFGLKILSGLPKEKIFKVFERFTNLKPTRLRETLLPSIPKSMFKLMVKQFIPNIISRYLQ